MKASESYLKMDHDFDHKILYFLLTRYAHLTLHKPFSLPQTIFLTANYFPYRKLFSLPQMTSQNGFEAAVLPAHSTSFSHLCLL